LDPTKDQMVIDFRQVGNSGLKRYSGFIFNDFLPDLQQWRGIEKYKEMQWNDPVIASCLSAIRMLCRRVPWRTKPSTQQGFDLEAAAFLESCLNDMSRTWLDIVDEILKNMLPYGFAPEEIVYKRRTGPSPNPSMRSRYSDGRIGWRKLEIRSPDTVWRWQFDDHGGVQGLYQLSPPHFQHTYIPINKLALFRTTTDLENPEGMSILRGAFRPWYMCKNIENIEAIGIERDLAGLPVIEAPAELFSASASVEQKALLATLKTMATNIRRDEEMGVVLPSNKDANGNQMYRLSLLSTAGSRQIDTDKVIQRYNMLKAMTMLADFMLMGHNAGGNRSIVDNRSNLFTTAICAYLDMIADVMNKHVIPRLFELNPDIQISDYPTIEHGDLESMDLDVLGKFMQAIAASGCDLFPNEELKKWLLKAAHAPEPVDPMKIADDLEVQPRKKAPPSKTVVVPADPYSEGTNEVLPITAPEPGIPPVQDPPPSVAESGDLVLDGRQRSMFDGPQGKLL
jgi:hypothetical protein